MLGNEALWAEVFRLKTGARLDDRHVLTDPNLIWPGLWLKLPPDGGALLGVSYSGLIDGGPDGYQALLDGQLPPDGTPIRITPRFQTAHPAYQWAKRVVCVGIGELHLSVPEVRYDIYAVS